MVAEKENCFYQLVAGIVGYFFTLYVEEEGREYVYVRKGVDPFTRLPAYPLVEPAFYPVTPPSFIPASPPATRLQREENDCNERTLT